MLAGTTAANRTSWTENSGSLVSSSGVSSVAQLGFLDGAYGVVSLQTCGVVAPIYCLEK